jgi:long-chain acyl-CoA synthetase
VIVEHSKQFVKIKKPIKTIIIEECKVLSTEVIFWKDLPKTTLSDDIIDECIATLDLKEPAVIIYTVTGSGPPLAAVLSHQNIAWTSQIAAQIGNVTKKTISLSYLPLSHIAEQLFTIHMHISIGYQVYFTKDKHIFKSMKSVRPTHLFGVPRVWEKLAESIESKMYSSTPFYGYLILCWAMGISKNVSALVRSGNTVSGLLSWKYGFVRGWIFPSIKEALGLSRMEVGVSGGAPISQETLTFFSSIDVPIIEVYGLSETSGVASANLFNQNKFGSVGFAPNGIDIKIIDGEICVRGPNVFLGYDQDEKSTEKVFIDGWLRTGDLGKIDSNGFIYITGRKKNIVITSGGKNISPENVEKMILKNPLISDCVVLADKRKFVVDIWKLNEKEADLVAIRLACKYPLHECPIMYKEVNNWIKTVNNDLSKPEMIRCLKIVKTMNQDGSRRKNMEEEHKDWLDKQMNSIK